jgi:hypothetical protein
MYYLSVLGYPHVSIYTYCVYKQSGSIHEDLLDLEKDNLSAAIAWMITSCALVAMLIVSGESSHQLLTIYILALSNFNYEVDCFSTSKGRCKSAMMQHLYITVLALTIRKSQVAIVREACRGRVSHENKFIEKMCLTEGVGIPPGIYAITKNEEMLLLHIRYSDLKPSKYSRLPSTCSIRSSVPSSFIVTIRQ